MRINGSAHYVFCRRCPALTNKLTNLGARLFAVDCARLRQKNPRRSGGNSRAWRTVGDSVLACQGFDAGVALLEGGADLVGSGSFPDKK